MALGPSCTRMSNLELLTPDEDVLALSQGWSLSHVYDLESSKWRVQVYGTPSSEMAGAFVVNQARAGNQLAIKALRLVQASHQQGTV